MGKKSAPAPPDYRAAAEETAAGSRQAARDQTYANRIDQNTPWGSLAYESYQDIDPATGEPVTRWRQNEQLTPELQAALNSQIGLQRGRSDLAGSMMGDIEGMMGTAMDFSKYGDLQGPGQQGMMSGAGGGLQGMSLEGLPAYQRQQLMQADKLASLGVLVAGVAHEINNPNYTIMSISNLMIEAWNGIVPVLREYYKENGDFVMGGWSYEGMHEKMPQFLTEIFEASKRIDNIVSDLKNFSRQEVYDLNSEVDINSVVRSAVALSNGFIKKLTRNFKVRYGRTVPKIKGNFQRLEQVVINLIQNACQALEDREKAICVMTEYNRDDQTVAIAVHDEGRGISSENLLKVKDPFFTTRRKSGGTGLGLAMSSRIVQDHHGYLSLTSELRRGTAVTVTLPVNNALKKEKSA